jgi:hypothetical protein
VDRVSNPFTPNAGVRPPELAGRQVPLQHFDTLLQRVQLGYTDKGVIITGLRGVGKTVLLNAFEELAIARNLVVVKHEASKQPNGFSRKFPSLARRPCWRCPRQTAGRPAPGAPQGCCAASRPSSTPTANGP